MELIKKEILFRGGRRGIRELDLLMQPVLAEIETLSELQLQELVELLKQNDLDLLDWFTEGKAPVEFNNSTFKLMLKLNGKDKS